MWPGEATSGVGLAGGRPESAVDGELRAAAEKGESGSALVRARERGRERDREIERERVALGFKGEAGGEVCEARAG